MSCVVYDALVGQVKPGTSSIDQGQMDGHHRVLYGNWSKLGVMPFQLLIRTADQTTRSNGDCRSQERNSYWFVAGLEFNKSSIICCATSLNKLSDRRTKSFQIIT